jgi:hypothetical protein
MEVEKTAGGHEAQNARASDQVDNVCHSFLLASASRLPMTLGDFVIFLRSLQNISPENPSCTFEPPISIPTNPIHRHGVRK